MADAKVFLTSGGSDSIDTATKMVRRYWQLLGQPERTILLRRERAYHGMHVGGTSLAGIAPNSAGYGPLLPDVEEVAWDDADALRATIERLGADRVAAFFCEPVIGAGGRVRAAARVPRAGARGLSRDRGAVRRRRGDHRVRTDRRVVRQHPVGARSRPRDLCEGHHERVPAARRGAGGADRLGTLLRRGRGDVPPRLHLLGARGGRGGGAGQPRPHGERRHPRASRRAGGPPGRGPSPAGGSRAGQRGPRGHRRAGGRATGPGAPGAPTPVWSAGWCRRAGRTAS